MTKRKTLLFGGVILLLASGAFAGQRTRGGEAVRGGGSDSAAPEFRRLAPGLGSVTINGVTTTIRSDNGIGLEQVVADYGSVEQYFGVHNTRGIASAPDADGVSILANNSIGLIPGFVSPSQLPMTVDDYKRTVKHMSTTVGGAEVTIFANGMVGMDTDQRGPEHFRAAVPTIVVRGEEISANNMIRN